MTMNGYQHPMWGISFTLPDGWQDDEDGDQVSISSQAYPGATLQVRCEWNGALRPVGPIWTGHIGKLAGIFGASEVGSVPWKLNDLNGIEAEIRMPKKAETRLWAGVLAHGFIILQLAITHPIEDKEALNPLFTRIVASLRFVEHTKSTGETPAGIPLPPGAAPFDPRTIIDDIGPSEDWEGCQTGDSIGALQAYYQRELPASGWTVSEFVPFPGSSFGFARFTINKDKQNAVLGIMPQGEKVHNASPGVVVIKHLTY